METDFFILYYVITQNDKLFIKKTQHVSRNRRVACNDDILKGFGGPLVFVSNYQNNTYLSLGEIAYF